MAGLVALPHAEESRDASRFTSWIAEGHAGTMQYLERVNESGELVRARVSTPFKWARSSDRVLCELPFRCAALNRDERLTERVDCTLCVEQSRR